MKVNAEILHTSRLDLMDEIEHLKAENVRLREALNWYADRKNWRYLPAEDGDPECIVPHAIPGTDEDGAFCCDCGDHARKALEGK